MHVGIGAPLLRRLSPRCGSYAPTNAREDGRSVTSFDSKYGTWHSSAAEMTGAPSSFHIRLGNGDI